MVEEKIVLTSKAKVEPIIKKPQREKTELEKLEDSLVDIEKKLRNLN